MTLPPRENPKGLADEPVNGVAAVTGVCVTTSELLGTRTSWVIIAPLRSKELGRLHSHAGVQFGIPWRGVSLPLNESVSVSDVRCGGGSRASGRLSMVGLVQFLLFTLWYFVLFFDSNKIWFQNFKFFTCFVIHFSRRSGRRKKSLADFTLNMKRKVLRSSRKKEEYTSTKSYRIRNIRGWS